MKYENKICPTCEGERFLGVTENRWMLCPRCGGDGALLMPSMEFTSKALDKILKDLFPEWRPDVS